MEVPTDFLGPELRDQGGDPGRLAQTGGQIRVSGKISPRIQSTSYL